MGDYAKAQPLYEKALAIWEVTLGADHPDVAHTLTDLAVLHLEQVHPMPDAALCAYHNTAQHSIPLLVALVIQVGVGLF